jgi:hypothetical protein
MIFALLSNKNRMSGVGQAGTDPPYPYRSEKDDS